MSMATGTRASVVIPTHNRRELVVRAVDHLLLQTHGNLEIIVACDRCDDGTEAALQALAHAHKLLVLQAKRPGQTGALNTGLDAAEGDIAIFIDDELAAYPEFVAQHIQAHLQQEHSTVAVIGGFDIERHGETDVATEMLAESHDRFFSELSRNGHRFGPRDLCGTNFSVRTQELRRLGGFNQDYFFARNDFELATRLIENGFAFHFAPNARGSLRIAETADLLVSRASQWARNDCRLAREHPWCAFALPFHANLQRPRTRLIWRLLWWLGPWPARVLQSVRQRVPPSRRLLRWEFAIRYCLGVRDSVSSWADLQKLCGAR